MMPSQPSHPAPRFVTIGRNVPLAGTGRGEAKPLICPTAQAKFSRRGSSIAATGLNGLAKLIFRRMQCRVDPAGQFRGKTGLAWCQCDEIVSTPQRSSCFDDTALFLPRSAVAIQ